MAKKREPVDELLDALVWMRRKAKKHEAVDDLVDALVKMRRKTKAKVAKRKRIKPRKKKKPAR
jgi:ClpP class serine protease